MSHMHIIVYFFQRMENWEHDQWENNHEDGICINHEQAKNINRDDLNRNEIKMVEFI